MEVGRGKFNCSACSWGRHCDDSNPAPYNKFVIKGFMESKTCFLPMVTDESRFLLRLYRHYKNGLLAVSGGVLDQPNYYLEAMETIDGYSGNV